MASDHQVYMDEEEGPFRCDHCEYYPQANHCNNKVIIGYAKQGKFGLQMDGSLALVTPGGCSDEFKRNTDMPVSNYFKGSGKKVMKNMKKQYGSKKGKQVFYATANKNKLDVGPKK